MPKRWAVLLILALLVITGCSARKASTAPDQSAAQGFLTMGGNTTQMGTIHYIREVTVRTDGQVDEVRIIQATDLFARLLSDNVDAMSQNAPDYNYVQSERDGVLQVRGSFTHDSLDTFNQSGFAAVRILNWRLYRTLQFDSAVGPLDDSTLGQMFPMISDTSNPEWVAFLHDAVRFSIVMKDQETGRTFTWTRSAGELAKTAPVSFTSKIWRPLSGYMLVGVGVLLLGVLYLGLFGRRHWDTAT